MLRYIPQTGVMVLLSPVDSRPGYYTQTDVVALEAELAAEREKNAKLLEANGKLMADAVCDDIREKVRKLIDEHGVLDDDLWAALKTELDAEREKVERLEAALRELASAPHAYVRYIAAAALNPDAAPPSTK